MVSSTLSFWSGTILHQSYQNFIKITASGDIYYLRLILLNRKACSDRDVLTYVPVRGGGEPIVCSSYQQSAIAHGYVDSVQDVTLTYDDMCSNGTASQCRSYFVVLTVHGYATHAIFDDYERRRFMFINTLHTEVCQN